MWAGAAWSPSMAGTGSPGSRLMSTKVSTVVPNSTGGSRSRWRTQAFIANAWRLFLPPDFGGAGELESGPLCRRDAAQRRLVDDGADLAHQKDDRRVLGQNPVGLLVAFQAHFRVGIDPGQFEQRVEL